MDEATNTSQPSPRNRRVVSSTRRTFIKRVIGGLAIAVPGFRVLAGATPASADTGSCSFIQYVGHTCGTKKTCPVGNTKTCWAWYKVYDQYGNFCYEFRDNEGPCK
jgi:hypothetical protein